MLRRPEKEEPLPPLSWVKLNDTCQSTDDVERALKICGWYREKLGWDECYELLRDEPVGRWFLRDGPDGLDDGYHHFVICLQTSRGVEFIGMVDFQGTFCLAPSVRVHVDMPFFECPVAMLEYHHDYAKRLDEASAAKACSATVNVQLYLREPLLKGVHSLKHLARLTVNKYERWLRRRIERLPGVVRDYLKEYPYTI